MNTAKIELSQIVSGMCQVSRMLGTRHEIMFQGELSACEKFCRSYGFAIEYTDDTRPLTVDETRRLRASVFGVTASACLLLASIRSEVDNALAHMRNWETALDKRLSRQV